LVSYRESLAQEEAGFEKKKEAFKRKEIQL